MLSLYERAVEALPAEHIDHHCTDLYLKATREATALINAWIEENGYQNAALAFVSRFFCELDGCFWYDIAFQYTPGWEALARGELG